MSNQKRKRSDVILPLSLHRDELEELRKTMPHRQRSAILRQLLINAGYLTPPDRKAS